MGERRGKQNMERSERGEKRKKDNVLDLSSSALMV